MNAATRNARATTILEEFFLVGAYSSPFADAELAAQLESVVSCKTLGFREILLVIAVARRLDPSYQASEGFYDCNPRALYEGPIRTALYAKGIPCGMSGPLNIAKATRAIDASWAAQRRPAAIATQVVKLVKKLDALDEASLRAFGTQLAARLLAEAKRIESIAVDLQPAEDPVFLAELCTRMIDDVPDAGNTPQHIVGLLLHVREWVSGSQVTVLGLHDRASVTSTTSKKLGDLALELPDGIVTSPIEVTVKPFGQSRVEESVESIHQYAAGTGLSATEVIVLCRPADVHPDARAKQPAGIYLGQLEYGGLTFYYVDIYEWIRVQLLTLPPHARRHFHELMNDYVKEPNTSEKVKEAWRDLNT